MNSSLFVSTTNGIKEKFFFFEYDLSTKKCLGRYLPGGRKRGQSLGGYTFGIHKNDLLWMYDIPINKIVTVSVKYKSTDRLSSSNDYMIKGDHRFAALMDSNRVLLYGLPSTQYKIQLLNLLTGKIITELGPINDKPEDIPLNAWKAANQGFLLVRPEEDKVILASIYTDRIEIFDLKTKKSKVSKGPEIINLNFKLGNLKNSIVLDNKARLTFNNRGIATSRYIYLLYSGENLKTGKHQNEGKYIYVYDWAGLPVKKLTLDRYIRAFTVSKDDDIIWGFDNASGYIVKSKSNLL